MNNFPYSAQGIMRFHLVYSGQLPASGNKPKTSDVARIRRELSPQLENLWENHRSLQVLKRTGAARKGTSKIFVEDENVRNVRQYSKGPYYEDCLKRIFVGDKWHLPLVRESLHLSCELDILFLRQDDPGQLVSQGGDIDNRIKTLLDALRVPERHEQDRSPFEEEGLFTLMQADTLVSRLDVDTDRLLFPQSEKANEVHLVIGVKMNVLEVTPYNMCLL